VITPCTCRESWAFRGACREVLFGAQCRDLFSDSNVDEVNHGHAFRLRDLLGFFRQRLKPQREIALLQSRFSNRRTASTGARISSPKGAAAGSKWRRQGDLEHPDEQAAGRRRHAAAGYWSRTGAQHREIGREVRPKPDTPYSKHVKSPCNAQDGSNRHSN
jgi:hypothetical protein